MTDCKKHYPKNPLRGALNAPGAVSAIEALHAAAKNLESIAEFSMQAVDRKIGALEELAATCGDLPDAEARTAIHRLSNEIFTEAGAFGYQACSQAAHSLCDLVVGGGKAPRAAFIRVHVLALRALRNSRGGKSVDAIIGALRELSRPRAP